jgi:D-amino-acid dehydrogenase
MSGNDADLIVAGGGIVGMSSALWAAMAGLRVVLCDPNPPGSGTTSGSACTIATYACLPVNSPDILTSLPRLMLSRDSPLRVDLWHAVTHPRWMLAFLANCRAARVTAITAALGGILREADAGLDPLIAEAGAEDLMVRNDCLYVWSTKAGFEGARAGTEARRAQGVALDVLTAAEVRGLEPELRMPVHAGLLFRGARHVRDPQALVARMQARFEALGGRVVAARVARTEADAEGVTAVLADGGRLRAGHLAVTAGAFSGRIAGSGAERLPLGTERGYHVLYAREGARISRPVGWAEAGFYATPMAQGLRLAGTVEIAALDKRADPGRIAYLRRKGAEMFGEMGKPDATWLGHRPTMPDALPVIGRSGVSGRVILAFGHQHIGLTLGGVTGRVVAEMVQGKAPSCDIAAFAPGRFG